MSHLEHHPDHLPCDRGDRGNCGERGGLVWRLCGLLLPWEGTLLPSWKDPLCLQGGLTPNDSQHVNQVLMLAGVLEMAREFLQGNSGRVQPSKWCPNELGWPTLRRPKLWIQEDGTWCPSHYLWTYRGDPGNHPHTISEVRSNPVACYLPVSPALDRNEKWCLFPFLARRHPSCCRSVASSI